MGATMSSETSVPPLPPGYTLDSQAAAPPPLPPGYTLDSQAPAAPTPNDISGEGRDEYGRPLGPLGPAAPTEPGIIPQGLHRTPEPSPTLARTPETSLWPQNAVEAYRETQPILGLTEAANLSIKRGRSVSKSSIPRWGSRARVGAFHRQRRR